MSDGVSLWYLTPVHKYEGKKVRDGESERRAGVEERGRGGGVGGIRRNISSLFTVWCLQWIANILMPQSPTRFV